MALTNAAPTLDTLPPTDAAPDELARWWIESGVVLQRYLGVVRDRLVAHMVEQGDLPGLGLAWRYEWAPDAGAEFPHLLRSQVLHAEHPDPAAIGRMLELLVEQVPDAKLTTETKIDGRKANQVILRGGADGARLQELRAARPRLEVK